MNITKKRSIWFTISGFLVSTAVAFIVIFGFNFGLDFTGGARWQLDFSEETETSVEGLKDFFATQDLQQAVQIQESGAGEYLITIEDLPDAEIQALAASLRSDVGEFTETSYRKVDSNIGQSFKQKALFAILAALIGIIIFVAIAFQKIPESIGAFRFGMVTIIALFHDILIILGVFLALGYFFDVELDLQFLTALLATLGFSVNDTIVILDRVRENIDRSKGKKAFEDVIEDSVKQTITRSINTSFSTLLPLLALLFLGADSIFFFILALVVGIVIGTYSSIFLAAPLLVTWKQWADNRA